jgi:hypothetical protein
LNSNGSPESLDLDRDLPTTAEDVEALRRAREMTTMDTEAYLRFLAQFGHASPERLRERKGPAGEPFDLLL